MLEWKQYKTALTVLSPGLELSNATLLQSRPYTVGFPTLEFACYLNEHIWHFEDMQP